MELRRRHHAKSDVEHGIFNDQRHRRQQHTLSHNESRIVDRNRRRKCDLTDKLFYTLILLYTVTFTVGVFNKNDTHDELNPKTCYESIQELRETVNLTTIHDQNIPIMIPYLNKHDSDYIFVYSNSSIGTKRGVALLDDSFTVRPLTISEQQYETSEGIMSKVLNKVYETLGVDSSSASIDIPYENSRNGGNSLENEEEESSDKDIDDYYQDDKYETLFRVHKVTDDYFEKVDDLYVQYFAFDDDENFHEYCRRPSWHRNIHPNCNNFHEVGLSFRQDDETTNKYLASGEYRNAFSILDGTAVLKVAAVWHKYNYEIFEMIRIDAMVMEALTSSERIVDIFGHCGLSVIVDYLRGTSLEELLNVLYTKEESYSETEKSESESKHVDMVQNETETEKSESESYYDDTEQNETKTQKSESEIYYDDTEQNETETEKSESESYYYDTEQNETESDYYSKDTLEDRNTKISGEINRGYSLDRNNLSGTDKLRIALQMAEAIADLHGYKNGVIAHNDIQYVQFFLNSDGNIVLSDFNRAEGLLYDENYHIYCPHYLGKANGNVRSPEEYAEKYVDEKIDVYSYGMALYSILSGLEPYIGYEQKEIYRLKLTGHSPKVSPFIIANSFAEMALNSVMEKCLEVDTTKRIDIFEAVKLLRKATQMNIEWNNSNL